MKIGGVVMRVDIVIENKNIIDFFFKVIILWKMLLRVIIRVKYFLV